MGRILFRDLKRTFSMAAGVCLLSGLSSPLLAASQNNLPHEDSTSRPHQVHLVQHQSPSVFDNALETSETPGSLFHTQWAKQEESLLAHGVPLTLGQVLDHVVNHSGEIEASEAKTRETMARLESVERKRVLFFFKYFNATYLEGSVESDIKAAEAHENFVRQTLMAQASKKYFDYIKALSAQYALSYGVQENQNKVTAEEKRFQAGLSQSFDLHEARNQYLLSRMDLVESQKLVQQGALAVAKESGLLETALKDGHLHLLIRPTELQLKSQEEEGASPHHLALDQFQQLSLVPEAWTAELVLEKAFIHRQDLKEMEYRELSMDKMTKAAQFEFDKSQAKIFEATYDQLHARLDELKAGIRQSVLVAWQEYQSQKQRKALAFAQWQMAKEAYRQIQISHQAGFSSMADVLHGEHLWAKAQANWLQSMLSYNLSQVQLLYEAGLLERNLFN